MGSCQTGPISWFVAVRTGLDAILAFMGGKTNSNGFHDHVHKKGTRKKLPDFGMEERPAQIARGAEGARTNYFKK